MSIDCRQLRFLIERVLRANELWSPAAVNLLLGTAAVESDFGTYIRQIRGPARGIYQMEPQTFEWLKEHYREKYPAIANRVCAEMEWDLWLATLLARLRYRIVPAELPPVDDIVHMADYWKTYYNTHAGAGQIHEFVEKFKHFVLKE